MLTIFKEVLDHGKTKKAVCDGRCSSGTDFVRIVRCGAGTAQSMCESVLAEVYERRGGLSRRSGVPSQSTCRRSGLRPRLRPAATVICPVRPMHCGIWQTHEPQQGVHGGYSDNDARVIPSNQGERMVEAGGVGILTPIDNT